MHPIGWFALGQASAEGSGKKDDGWCGGCCGCMVVLVILFAIMLFLQFILGV